MFSKSTKKCEKEKVIICKSQGYKSEKSDILEIPWRIRN